MERGRVGVNRNVPTLDDALRAAARRLASAGIPEPRTDARLLLLAAAGVDRVALVSDPDQPLAPSAAARFDTFVYRRAAREPVSRILGQRDFWGLTLRITPDVLDPRPDTETLVEMVLDDLGDRRQLPLKILDLGTGSGAIVCALLTELPSATGWALDRSAAACQVARGNLDTCGFAARGLVVQGDWAEAFGPGTFDVVVSNPPYIETAVIAGLDADVRDHDPLAALDGGPDGLAAYRALAAVIPDLLAPGGTAALEIGRGQADAVTALLGGLVDVEVRRDLARIERVVLGRRG